METSGLTHSLTHSFTQSINQSINQHIYSQRFWVVLEKMAGKFTRLRTEEIAELPF